MSCSKKNTSMNGFLFPMLMLPLMLPLMTVSAGQSEYIDTEQSGAGAAVSFISEQEGTGISLCPTYSIDGIIDIGLDMQLLWGEDLLEDTARKFDIGASLGFTVLKQDQITPFSFLLSTALHYLSETSDAYSESGITASGTGFSLGAKIYTYWFVVPRLYAKLGAEVKQRRDTYVYEKADDADLADFPSGDTKNVLNYGLVTGMTWRPNTPNRGIAVSFDLLTGGDSHGRFQVKPTVTMTVVANSF